MAKRTRKTQSQTISSFDRKTAEAFHNEFEEMAQALAKKYGLEVRTGTARLNESMLRISKVEFSTTSETGESNDLLAKVKAFGLKLSTIQKTFKTGKHAFKLVDIKTRRNVKKRFVMVDENTGRNYKLSADQIPAKWFTKTGRDMFGLEA